MKLAIGLFLIMPFALAQGPSPAAHYQFVYAKNAGHVDSKVINQTLSQALEFLWKGYPIQE